MEIIQIEQADNGIILRSNELIQIIEDIDDRLYTSIGRYFYDVIRRNMENLDTTTLNIRIE